MILETATNKKYLRREVMLQEVFWVCSVYVWCLRSVFRFHTIGADECFIWHNGSVQAHRGEQTKSDSVHGRDGSRKKDARWKKSF